MVKEAEAAAIRKAYEEGSELSAVAELRRHFPRIADNENARLCVRTIASWQPALRHQRSSDPIIAAVKTRAFRLHAGNKRTAH